MKKQTKKIITLEDGIRLIPHDEFYCNDSGECPFWSLRKITENKLKELIDKGETCCFVPTWCKQGTKYKLEYCQFLKTFLDIQDGCKDCGINCDRSEEQIKLEIDFLEKEIAEGVNEYYTKEDIEEYKEELEKLKNHISSGDDSYRQRIKNREYADFYKEKFPDEVDLIDRIVKEDKLKYWHKDKKEE